MWFWALFSLFVGLLVWTEFYWVLYRKIKRFKVKLHVKLSTIKLIFSLFIEYLKIQVIQKYNSTLKRIDKQTFSVSFLLHGQKYTVLLRNRRGPGTVSMILNENSDDITEIVEEYMGPCEDWFGRKFAPSFWKYDKLIFVMSDGRELTFEGDEKIAL